MAILQMDSDDDEAAYKTMTKCVALGTNDIDHLKLAYKLYKKIQDEQHLGILEKIKKINPIEAQMLEEIGD